MAINIIEVLKTREPIVTIRFAKIVDLLSSIHARHAPVKLIKHSYSPTEKQVLL